MTEQKKPATITEFLRYEFTEDEVKDKSKKLALAVQSQAQIVTRKNDVTVTRLSDDSITRLDTGDIVREIAMLPSELQENLFAE